MKKFLSKLSEEGCALLLGMFLFVPIVLFVIGLALYIPIDYIKYKRSLYYKKTREKYSLYMGISPVFNFHNVILKNNLPIEFFPRPEETDNEYGWFVYNNTLILLNAFQFEFDDEKNEWAYKNKNDVLLTLDEYIESDINGVNKVLGKTVCDKAIVLIKSKDVGNVELAKNDERFLVYDKNMEEVICAFCNL